jgi:hypothetical protein
MTVVSDTSPLNYLILIVGAHLITRFFDGAPAGEEPPRV